MLGAIIGDIAGSRFERKNIHTKDFELFTGECLVTDDSVMTLAIGKAILESNEDYSNLGEMAVKYMREVGQSYSNCGYGGHFFIWMYSKNPKPYNSFGNGSAMRVSACGFVGNSLEDVKNLSKAVTEVTHNHPEGIKGAEAAAVAIYLARTGKSIAEIKEHMRKNYYPQEFTIDGIREKYKWDATCQGTVPVSLQAFFESTSFEDAIRTAISVGGDSDTLAAITGGIAQAYYGIPTHIRKKALEYLDSPLLKILNDFENRYAANIKRV